MNTLLKKLGVAAREFNLPSPVFYVRGRRLTSNEITSGRCGSCNAEGPFHLKQCERGMSAVELIRFAIREVLQAVNFPGIHQGKARQLKRKIKEEDFDNETWYYIKEYGVYQGLHLYSIGFWNLLQHFLSNEAFIMVHDVLSLESILGNWNAAEAIPWFLADFSSDQFDMVPGGLSLVASELERDITHLLLTEIHGREIPHPILGIARDWDAGWHTWIVGSKPWEPAVREQRVQPLDGLYLCGEAYSPEQGWIEGALKSSEQILRALGVREPDWLEGLHPDLGGYIDPYKGLPGES